MKVLLKKEVCGSREQCTGPMCKTLVAYRYPNVHLLLKKKKKKKKKKKTTTTLVVRTNSRLWFKEQRPELFQFNSHYRLSMQEFVSNCRRSNFSFILIFYYQLYRLIILLTKLINVFHSFSTIFPLKIIPCVREVCLQSTNPVSSKQKNKKSTNPVIKM